MSDIVVGAIAYMSDAKQNIAILNEYCEFIDDLISSNSLNEGSLTSVLTEAFTSKSFAGMVRYLAHLENMIPDEMSNTLKAVRIAIDKTEKNYAKMIRKQITKEDFAKSVSQTRSLIDALENAFNDIKHILTASKMKKKLAQRMGTSTSETPTKKAVKTTLSSVLDQNAKDILRAKIETAFKQPDSVLGKIWKALSPESYGWFGLTDGILFTDLMKLTRSGLIKLGRIETEVLDDMFSPSAERSIAAALPDIEEIQFDEEGEPLPVDALGRTPEDIKAAKENVGDIDDDEDEVGHGSLSVTDTIAQKKKEQETPAETPTETQTPKPAKSRAEQNFAKVAARKAAREKAEKAEKEASNKNTIIPFDEPEDEENPIAALARKRKIGKNEGIDRSPNESMYSEMDRAVLDRWRRMAGIPFRESK